MRLIREMVPESAVGIADKQAEGSRDEVVATSVMAQVFRAFGIPSASVVWWHEAIGVADAARVEGVTSATSLNNAGSVLSEWGRLDEAMEMFRRALDLCDRSVGMDHPVATTVLNIITGGARELVRLDGALDGCEEAHEGWRRTLGEDDVRVGLALRNMGMLVFGMGRLDDMIEVLRRALDVSEWVLGGEHPEAAQSLRNVAWVMQSEDEK